MTDASEGLPEKPLRVSLTWLDKNRWNGEFYEHLPHHLSWPAPLPLPREDETLTIPVSVPTTTWKRVLVTVRGIEWEYLGSGRVNVTLLVLLSMGLDD